MDTARQFDLTALDAMSASELIQELQRAAAVEGPRIPEWIQDLRIHACKVAWEQHDLELADFIGWLFGTKEGNAWARQQGRADARFRMQQCNEAAQIIAKRIAAYRSMTALAEVADLAKAQGAYRIEDTNAKRLIIAHHLGSKLLDEEQLLLQATRVEKTRIAVLKAEKARDRAVARIEALQSTIPDLETERRAFEEAREQANQFLNGRNKVSEVVLHQRRIKAKAASMRKAQRQRERLERERTAYLPIRDEQQAQRQRRQTLEMQLKAKQRELAHLQAQARAEAKAKAEAKAQAEAKRARIEDLQVLWAYFVDEAAKSAASC